MTSPNVCVMIKNWTRGAWLRHALFVWLGSFGYSNREVKGG